MNPKPVAVWRGGLKQVAICILCMVGIAAAASRIPTNPAPDDHLKKLFPRAVAFSPLQGEPLHFKAYATVPRLDAKSELIGLAFWTTDLVPDEHGYHGAIHVLVGMDMTGTLTGVVVDWDAEPYGHFSVRPPAFAAQFAGKTVQDSFKVGADIDAVSRATISIASAARAVRDSSRMIARRFLTPEVVTR